MDRSRAVTLLTDEELRAAMLARRDKLMAEVREIDQALLPGLTGASGPAPDQPARQRRGGRRELEAAQGKLLDAGCLAAVLEERVKRADAPQPSAWPELSALGLSNRVRIALRRNGIETVQQLCAQSADELRQHRLIGQRTIEEIRVALLKARLQLKGDEWTCPG